MQVDQILFYVFTFGMVDIRIQRNDVSVTKLKQNCISKRKTEQSYDYFVFVYEICWIFIRFVQSCLPSQSSLFADTMDEMNVSSIG